MCRFIAVISHNYFNPKLYVEKLENIARYGRSSPHGDGWGLWIKSGHGEYLYHETSPIWERNVQNFPDAEIMFLHARKRGKNGAEKSLLNTHPFIRKDSVFMHNGFVEITHPGTTGDTDSEKMFLSILELGIWNFLVEVRNHKYSSINFVMYHSGKIYVLRSAKRSVDYYSIYIDKKTDKIVISTEGNGKLIENHTLTIIDENFNIEYRQAFPDTLH